MNAEHILDAMGLLDDDLIQEAEQYRHKKSRTNYGPWLAWAASFLVVIALGYGVTHIRMGSGNSTANSGGAAIGDSAAGSAPSSWPQENGQPSPFGSSGGAEAPGEQEDSSRPGADLIPESPASSNSSGQTGEADYCAAIMVDGVLYWSTDTPIPAEVDESAIRTVTSYTDTQPEEDGQTNFDRSLTTQYAMTDQGLLVLIEQEWILFEPTPPGK